MQPIAHIETPYATKFGVPRQAGIVDCPCRIVFEPDFRIAEAVRGLEGFDYIWLIWHFSQTERKEWSPTVRPPRLGGNQHVGVFATRSPFRPNALGLSSVKLDHIEYDSKQGPILIVSGADLMDKTPIFDIKPYLPYTDSHPEARSGFATQPAERLLEVVCDETLLETIPTQFRAGLLDTLAHDPRPQYHNDPERIYGMDFASHNIRFIANGQSVKVISISPITGDTDPHQS